VKFQEIILYPIEENKLYGFIDSKGDVIVKPKYSFVEEFSEGMCCVCITGTAKRDKEVVKNILLAGYINSKGEEIISLQFVGGGKRFREGLAMVQFQSNWKWGFIDKTGNTVIQPRYDQEYSYGFSEGYAGVALGEKWGYIDKNDKVAIPFEYDWTYPFKNGFAIVKRNNKKSFIDKNGNTLKTIKCIIVDTVQGGFKDGLAVVKIGKQYGFINTEGQLAIQELFDEAWGFHEGLCSIKKGNKYGYINIQGEYVIPPKFEQARPHSGGIATFNENGKWGLIGLAGDIIKEPCFDYIDHFDTYEGDLSQLVERGLTRAVNGTEEYYINRTGKIIAEKKRKTNSSVSQEDFFKTLFEKKSEKKEVWDKAEWYYDGISVTKKSATRHIYFVLKWLKNKELLTEEGLEWNKDKNNVDIGLYRSMVTEQAADFLDRCYKEWYENESIVNFQIDPDLKFSEDEQLNIYWLEYLKITSPNSTLPKAGRSWLKKLFGN
jgi:hypothetical protein